MDLHQKGIRSLLEVIDVSNNVEMNGTISDAMIKGLPNLAYISIAGIRQTPPERTSRLSRGETYIVAYVCVCVCVCVVCVCVADVYQETRGCRGTTRK
jgi:hypothetical protein